MKILNKHCMSRSYNIVITVSRISVSGLDDLHLLVSSSEKKTALATVQMPPYKEEEHQP